MNETINSLNQKLNENDTTNAKLKDNILQKNETINDLQNVKFIILYIYIYYNMKYEIWNIKYFISNIKKKKKNNIYK